MKTHVLLAAFLPCYAGLYYWATNQAAEIPKAAPFTPALNVSTNPVLAPSQTLTSACFIRPGGKLVPGVYSTKPYSMMVLVPRPTDQDMIQHPSSNATFSGRIIKPRLQFETVAHK